MAWKTLGESLEAALASMMNEVGKGSGGTLPDAVKGTGTDEGAGQVHWRNVSTESGGEAAPVTTQPAEAASLGNAKGRPVHHKAPPQRRTGQPLALRVIEGGGGRRQEGGASAAFRTRAGGGGRGCKLKLVVG